MYSFHVKTYVESDDEPDPKHKITKNKIKKMAEEGISVPGDFETLREAVDLVYDSHESTKKYVDHYGKVRYFNKIVLGVGEYHLDTLVTRYAMHIVGDPSVMKENIVVNCGVVFLKDIQGNCHLQNLTIFDADYNGVVGQSSFTMEDVIVKGSANAGVKATGNGVVGICTNVEVTESEYNGIVASDGARIILTGLNTRVHQNCKAEALSSHGLQIYGYSASDPPPKIQLVSPLTKEEVSTDNGGGGNWGAHRGGDINQIKTITKAELTTFLEEEAAKASRIEYLNPSQRKCGGYTDARQLKQDDLAVWDKVLALPDTGAELAAKGTPTSVQTAVVSGLKYKFAFEDGSTVIVWRTWRNWNGEFNAISIVNH